jgi:ribonuclease HI
MNQYIVYTDGSSLGNPGPGGYGVVIKKGGDRKELSDGYRKTTNNRMEMLAAAVALESIPEGSEVVLHSDSKLLIDAFNQFWIKSWQAKGWRKADKSAVLNVDLWKRILAAMAGKKVKYVWVKGHDGIPENERCDILGRDAASANPQKIDLEYEKQNDTSSLFRDNTVESSPAAEENTMPTQDTRIIETNYAFEGEDREYVFAAKEVEGIGTFIEVKIRKSGKEKVFYIGKGDLQGVIDILSKFL